MKEQQFILTNTLKILTEHSQSKIDAEVHFVQ